MLLFYFVVICQFNNQSNSFSICGQIIFILYFLEHFLSFSFQINPDFYNFFGHTLIIYTIFIILILYSSLSLIFNNNLLFLIKNRVKKSQSLNSRATIIIIESVKK